MKKSSLSRRDESSNLSSSANGEESSVRINLKRMRLGMDLIQHLMEARTKRKATAHSNPNTSRMTIRMLRTISDWKPLEAWMRVL